MPEAWTGTISLNHAGIRIEFTHPCDSNVADDFHCQMIYIVELKMKRNSMVFGDELDFIKQDKQIT